MSATAEGITHVRLRPMAVDLGGDGALLASGAIEVTWDSTQEGQWHQVYVNGCLAGVTARPTDRRLVVPAPVGRDGTREVLLVEVVAVESADRWTDFADELSGLGEGTGAEVRLTWQAGEYLDPNLVTFDVFGDGRSGTVDYDTPLNEFPIPAQPTGQAPWGYGCGGYGVGAYGQSAAPYEWRTDPLEPGTWCFAVVAVDAAGNHLATAAEVEIDVAPLPRPPSNFRVSDYDAQGRMATLSWEKSPDL